LTKQSGWSACLLMLLANVGGGQEPPKEKPYLVLDAGRHTDVVGGALFTGDDKEIITMRSTKKFEMSVGILELL
jgi:hypothetical protein